MKNIKMDTSGHIISYENDYGATITDYKQLAKSAGLDSGIPSYHESAKSSDSSSYSSLGILSGADYERDRAYNRKAGLKLTMLGMIIGFFCISVFSVVAWIFFNWIAALIITLVLFGVPLAVIIAWSI